MIQELKKEFSLFKLLVLLLTIAISIYLIQILWQFLSNFSDIIIILVMAWLLSFILEPLVRILENFLKVSKVVSAIIVYLFFAFIFSLAVFIFFPVVTSQLQSLSKIVPVYFSAYPKFVQTWNNAITNSVDSLIGLIPSLASLFLNIILILFLSFYFIVDKDKINEEIYKLAPNGWHKNLKFTQKVIDETFSSFLQIQVIFGVILGLSTWIVLTVFGVNFASSVALLAGILTIIPIIGPLLALVPPVFVVLATSGSSATTAVLIFAILLLIQQIVFNFVGPKLMGKAFKLHPIVVFLSIIIGFKVAGPLGAIFVVPVLGVTVIVLKRLGHYFINPPPETLNKS